MKIYNYLGVEILDIDVDDKSYRYKELMSDNQLFLYYSLPTFVELPIGAYVDFKAERYYLSDPSNFKMNHTRDWEYTVVLDSYIALTKTTKFKFFTLVGGLVEGDFELKFSLTETAAEFAALFVRNMNQADPAGGWQVGDCIDTEPILLDFNHTFCYDVLADIAEKFKTEWEIVGKTLHLRKVEKMKESPTPLTYGYNSGLIPGFTRSNAGKKKANRLYVETSDRNIDSATYGRKTLSLLKSASIEHNGITYITDTSGSYIERINRTGLVLENSADLTHIHPKRIGTVTDVVVVNADKHLYDIIDSNIEPELDYSELIIPGETMTIIFQTGQLAGLEFDVRYIHASRKFELVPIAENGINYPTASLSPAVGDKYIVFHCSLPSSYIATAEADATAEAAAELYEQEQEKFTYNGVLDELYAKRNWLAIGGKLDVGYFVALTLQNAITTPVDIRIVAVKDFVNKPQQPEITLSNEVSGKQLGSALAIVKNKEQAVNRINADTTRFAKRGFREAQETAEMLQGAMLNFSGAINPITVQAMQYIAGDISLQFDFVANSASKEPIAHAEYFNPANKQFTSEAGIIMHKTLGVETLSSSYPASALKWWNMAGYVSPVLTDAGNSYYLYAKCSKTANTGTFLLSEAAIAIEQVAGHYHLLMGILNSEYDNDRSYSPMYGYSEWTPGRFTIKKIASPDGEMVIDLEARTIKANALQFKSNGVSKSVEQGFTDAATDATNKVNGVQVGGRNLLRNANINTTNSEYGNATLQYGNLKPGKNKQYTVTIKGKFNEAGPTGWHINYFDGTNYPALTWLSDADKIADDVWRKTFVWPDSDAIPQASGIYQYPLGGYKSVAIEWVQIEAGNKGTDFTLAPEDDEAAINAINSTLSDISNDNKLTPDEKQTVKKEWDAIAGEYSKLIAQADSLSVSYTVYAGVYSALNTYLSPLIANLNTTSDIVGSTFRNNFTNYYNARTDLQNALTAKVQGNVDNIKIGGVNLLLDSKRAYGRTGIGYVYAENDLKPLAQPLIAGKQYIFTHKGTASATLSFSVLMSGWSQRHFITPNVPFTAGSNATHILIYQEGAGTSNIFELQLEEGNKATAWSPSPQDVVGESLEFGSGKNILSDSEFLGGFNWSLSQTHIDLTAMQHGINVASEWTLNGNMNAYNSEGLNVAFLLHGAHINNSGDFAYMSKNVSGIEGGKKYIASVYVGNHRAQSVAVYFDFYDVNGTWIAWSGIQSSSACGTDEFIGGKTIAGYKRIYTSAIAPANAVLAAVIIKKHQTIAGQGNSYAFITRPAFEQVHALTTKPGPWSPSVSSAQAAQAAAAAQAAQTTTNAITNNISTIDGGLLLTTLIKMMNAGVDSAGMAAKTPTNDIAFWGGGTLEDAIQKISKFGVTHSGEVWVRGFIEALSGKIGGLNIANNSLSSSSMQFSESPVDTISQLLSPSAVSITQQASWSAESDGVELCVAYTQPITVPWQAKLNFNANARPGAVEFNDQSYSVYILNESNQSVFSESGRGDKYKNFNISVPPGTYRIFCTARSTREIGGFQLTDRADLRGIAVSNTITGIGFVAKTMIGNNGLLSFWSAANYLYYSALQGLQVRGATDIPAGLGGGTISNSGTFSKGWGLAHSATRVTNTTTIKHSVTDTKFTVIVIPKITCTWYLQSITAASSPTANNGDIFIVCSTSTAAFDFIIVRTPY